MRLHRGHRSYSFTASDVNELVELRARQRTFHGAYSRSALSALGYSLTILRLFDHRFYKSELPSLAAYHPAQSLTGFASRHTIRRLWRPHVLPLILSLQALQARLCRSRLHTIRRPHDGDEGAARQASFWSTFCHRRSRRRPCDCTRPGSGNYAHGPRLPSVKNTYLL